MKPCRLVLVLFALALALPALAEEPITATTESGRAVLLYSDGSWKYKDQDSASSTSPKSYSKPSTATGRLALDGSKVLVNYDPKRWRKADDAAEPGTHKFALVSDGQETGCFALAVQNSVSMEPDMVEGAFLGGIKRRIPDARVTSQEKRLVNGKEVLCAQMKGTVQTKGMTIPMVMLSYFYCGKEGTVMESAIAPGFLFDEHRQELEEFLNGLEIAP